MPLRAEVRVRAQHLVRRHVLGDADHGVDARVHGLVDRVDGEARRDEDERRVRAGLVDGVGDRVEDGDALDVLAALARRDAGDEVRAVRPVAQAVEAALASRSGPATTRRVSLSTMIATSSWLP